MNKNFINRFIKGIASRSIGTFLQIFLGFFSLAVAVRFVSKDEFGIYVIALVISSFFETLSLLVIQPLSITRFISCSEDYKKTQVVNTSISASVFIAIIFSIIAFLCQPVILNIFKSNYLLSKFFMFIPIFYVLSIFNQLFQKILQGFQEYKKMTISQVINSSIRIILILIFLIKLKMGLIGLIYAFIFSSVASIFFQYSVIKVKKHLSFNLNLFIQMLKFGFPLGLNNILSFIFLRVDRLMIGAMLNHASVAYYEVASKIPDSSSRMHYSFNDVFFPNMVELFKKKKFSDAEKILNNSLRLITFIILLLTLFIGLFQNELVAFLFSKQYLKSAPALFLLMLAITIGLEGHMMGTSLVALGQSDKPVKINIVHTVSNLVGNLIMIPRFGFMGAVYATLLACCLTNPVNVWFLKKARVRIKVSQYLKPLGAFVLCSIVMWIDKSDVLVSKFFIIILFLIMCVALKVIKMNDLNIVYKTIKRSKIVVSAT